PNKFNYIDLIQPTKNKNKIIIMNDQQIKTIIINDHFKVKLNGTEEYYFEDMDYDNFRRNFFKDKSFFIMDEFDSMYNTLESVLNIPINSVPLINNNSLIPLDIWILMINFIPHNIFNSSTDNIIDDF